MTVETRFGLPAGTRLWKGHGTGNCFLLMDSPQGDLDVPADSVAALCDVATGIGADGLIRCVRRDGVWFMDYRNADGSLAEMCGNGIRVFVDHLRRQGLVSLAVGGTLPVLTRGGMRAVRLVEPEARTGGPGRAGTRDAWYSVDMGPAVTSGQEDMRVRVVGLPGVRPAIRVALPNPHAVVEVGSREALAAAILPVVDIAAAPEAMRPVYDPEPAHGVNLELTVDVTGQDSRAEGTGADPARVEGHVLMRVLERGVGETQSCGTGCCAAAVAAAIRRSRSGAGTVPRVWRVDIPGGTVRVELPRDPGGSVILSGPATRVAEIVL